MGPTILFTQLKIILLQCFQFSVFSNNKLNPNTPYVLFMDPQIPLFNNFFIKNWSHSTIYTFKNYFATMISAINFQFQQNKFYPNRPLVFNQLFFLTYASRSPHFSVSTTLPLPQFFKHRVKQQIISLSQLQPSLALPLSLSP